MCKTAPGRAVRKSGGRKPAASPFPLDKTPLKKYDLLYKSYFLREAL